MPITEHPPHRTGRAALSGSIAIAGFCATEPTVRRYRSGLFRKDLRRIDHLCQACRMRFCFVACDSAEWLAHRGTVGRVARRAEVAGKTLIQTTSNEVRHPRSAQIGAALRRTIDTLNRRRVDTAEPARVEFSENGADGRASMKFALGQAVPRTEDRGLTPARRAMSM